MSIGLPSPGAGRPRNFQSIRAKWHRKVAGKAPCIYRGYYHTDFTVPSLYFRDDVERPDDAASLDLDFTYLYVDSVNNPAFARMGIGEQIRGDESGGTPRLRYKAARQWGREVRRDELPEDLRSALESS